MAEEDEDVVLAGIHQYDQAARSLITLFKRSVIILKLN